MYCIKMYLLHVINYVITHKEKRYKQINQEKSMLFVIT